VVHSELKLVYFSIWLDEHFLHRKHTHTGLVYGLQFSVQFIVQEEKVSSMVTMVTMVAVVAACCIIYSLLCSS